MTIAITISEPVPGGEKVNGTVECSVETLVSKKDPGAFLLRTVQRLAERVSEEVKSKKAREASSQD